MNCKNCGNAVPDTAEKCPGCGAVVNNTDFREQNSSTGKEYNFWGNALLIRFHRGTQYKIILGEDRLFFEAIPKGKIKIPEIMLKDITAINNSFHMRIFNILIGILGIVVGFTINPLAFILPVFVLLFYRQKKIKIQLSNGQTATIYCNDNAIAREFVTDVNNCIHI